MTTPDPTNRPAPMTPPIAIIVRWRCLRPFLRSVDSVSDIPHLRLGESRDRTVRPRDRGGPASRIGVRVAGGAGGPRDPHAGGGDPGGRGSCRLAPPGP